MLNLRISIFVNLQFQSLYRLSLQKHLDEIEQASDGASK